jgi:hypothetical protein
MQGSPTVLVQRIALVLLVAGFAGFAPAQTAQPLPSRQEIDELISKADQKIAALSAALTSARHDIESTAPDLWKNQMDTVSTAREMIKIVREKGPSAYRLVALNTIGGIGVLRHFGIARPRHSAIDQGRRRPYRQPAGKVITRERQKCPPSYRVKS